MVQKIIVVMVVVAREISAIQITRLQKIEAIGGPQEHERMITKMSVFIDHTVLSKKNKLFEHVTFLSIILLI